MAAMNRLYIEHECERMTPAQLAGLQTLMEAGSGPLAAGELSAMHASPKLRAWLLVRLAAFGSYVLHERLADREPVRLEAFLGDLRPEIAAEVMR